MNTPQNDKTPLLSGNRTVAVADIVGSICAQIIKEGFDARRKRIESQAKRKGLQS